MNVVDAVIARLEADVVFMAQMPGGVYNRPISREGRGKTPQAFDANLFIRPSVTVEEGDEAPGDANMRGSYRETVAIHFYGPSDTERKAMISAAYERAVKVLKLAQPDNPSDTTPWWYVNGDGRRMFPEAHSATRIYPSEVYVGNSEKIATFRFHGTRKAY